ncbi:MAG: ABC transporter permease [Endomicrobiia bacterium]|nr:ABC transporter permease [Endomicrobiia bacterium]
MKPLKRELEKIFAFTYRNYIFMKRNIFTFFEILFWPMVGLFSIGLMGNFLGLKENMLSFLLTGTILSGVLQVTQLDVSYGVLYEVWSKSIKQIFVAPVRHYNYIIGSWLFGIVRGMSVFAFMSFMAGKIFGFVPPPMKTIIISLAGIFLMALVIGMTVSLSVLIFGQRIDIIAWSMTIMLMLVCGIYYPVSFLPAPVAAVAKLIPLTYFLEYFRAPYGFESSLASPLLKGFGLLAVCILALFALIALAYRRARRTGAILRLSE